MIKIILLITLTFLFSGCVNKRGITAKYYSECKEYYDLQGYYHRDCDEENMVTYKEMGESVDSGINSVKSIFVDEEKKEVIEKNVW